MTVLDVGLGGACVVELPGGGTILYDGGSNHGGDPGRYLIAPALWAAGRSRIDVVVLSHPHRDHVNGLPELLERFPVGLLIVPPGFEQARLGRTVLRLAAARHVPVQIVAAGDRVAGLGEGVEVRVLGPPGRGAGGFSRNDASVVLMVEAPGGRLLLTGDIEAAGTAAMLESGADLRCDVVLVPHHGSENALSPELAGATGAGLAVVSTPEGFPAPGTLAAYEEGGCEVLRTSEMGAVRVELREGGISRRAYLIDPW